MITCNSHEECLRGYVQGPTDVSRIISCMVQRGIIRETRGPGFSRFVTNRTRLLTK